MQWRMLVRRCPSGSMTVVGDLDQAMSATALQQWEDLTPHLPGRLSVHELTVNYRTPAEIMAYVERQAAVIGIRHHPPRSVRYSGREPQVLSVAPGDLERAVDEALDAVADEPGTVAVVAATALRDRLAASVADDDVPVVTARQAKGLEFDAVVLVGPGMIAKETSGGAALYVALTRATRDLAVLDVEEPV